MKKFTMFFSALLLVLTLAACGGDNKDDKIEGLTKEKYAEEVNALADEYDTKMDEFYTENESLFAYEEEEDDAMSFEVSDEFKDFIIESNNISIDFYDGLSKLTLEDNEDSVKLAELYEEKVSLLERWNETAAGIESAELFQSPQMMELDDEAIALDEEINSVLEKMIDDEAISEDLAFRMGYYGKNTF